MSRGRDRQWTLAVVVGLASGCAAQHEEPAQSAPAGEFDEALELSEPSGVESSAEPSAEPSERSLDDIERELAVNQAKLRALGVALPSTTAVGKDASSGDGETAKSEKKKSQAGRLDGIAPSGDAGTLGGGSAGGASRPSAQPGTGSSIKSTPAPKPEPKPTSKPKPKPKPKPKKDQGQRSEDEAKVADRDADPEAAKSAPLSPNGGTPEQDAAGRCQQICGLTQVTCELGAQLCDLADRHPDEDDYQSACERAIDDCRAAQEACDACDG